MLEVISAARVCCRSLAVLNSRGCRYPPGACSSARKGVTMIDFNVNPALNMLQAVLGALDMELELRDIP